MLTAVYDTRSSTDVMEIQKDAQYLKEEMTGCIYRHFKGELYIVTDVVRQLFFSAPISATGGRSGDVQENTEEEA